MLPYLHIQHKKDSLLVTKLKETNLCVWKSNGSAHWNLAVEFCELVGRELLDLQCPLQTPCLPAKITTYIICLFPVWPQEFQWKLVVCSQLLYKAHLKNFELVLPNFITGITGIFSHKNYGGQGLIQIILLVTACKSSHLTITVR